LGEFRTIVSFFKQIKISSSNIKGIDCSYCHKNCGNEGGRVAHERYCAVKTAALHTGDIVVKSDACEGMGITNAYQVGKCSNIIFEKFMT
jgi:hypothetical protein